MGGDLGGTGGTVPPNLRWGDGPCIGPQIFREVVLSDARESTNRVRKVLSRNFGVKMEIFPETSFRNLGPGKNFPPPNSAPGLRH